MSPKKSKCDPQLVAEFNYGGLSSEFSKLSKPAQRALINEGIFTSKHLARKTLEEIQELHGIGPSAFPILRAALKKAGLNFRKSLK